jgi:hypothetical protein
MTVCWLVVNTLLGMGMQVVAEAVALGLDRMIMTADKEKRGVEA